MKLNLGKPCLYVLRVARRYKYHGGYTDACCILFPRLPLARVRRVVQDEAKARRVRTP
jgi:hypothetical protein